jgi:type I restriction enzyme, S subunit
MEHKRIAVAAPLQSTTDANTHTQGETMEQNGLPQGWVQTTLGEVCAEVKRSSPDKLFSTEFDYIDISSIDNNTQIITKTQKVQPKSASPRARQIVKAQDVLLSTTRVYLKNIAMVPDELDGQIASTAFCVLRPIKEAIDASYLNYFVGKQDFINTLTTLQRGNSPPAVLEEDVKAQQIPLPPLNEQRRIVSRIEELFSDLDAGEASLRRTQKLLATYRQSVLKAAVTGELTRAWREAHGPAAETGAQLLLRIKKERRAQWKGRGAYQEPAAPDTTALPELPEGWVWASVDTLASPEAHSIADGPFGSNLKTEHYTVQGVRVIRLENIGDGYFVNRETYISAEHASKLQRHSISPGDIVIASLGVPLPKACVIPNTIEKAIVKADCIKYRPNSKYVDRNYMLSWLVSPQLRGIVSTQVRGVSRPRINLGDIKKFAVPLPSLPEQQAIADLLDDIFSRIDALEAWCATELRRSATLRQAILKAAFSGTLVPQEAVRSRNPKVSAIQIPNLYWSEWNTNDATISLAYRQSVELRRSFARPGHLVR